MLEQAITEIQNIERSVARKTLSDLQIRLALRSVGSATLFADEGGVPSPGFAIVLPAGAFLSRGVGMFPLGATVSAPPGFDPGSAAAGFSSLAATTPLPVNSPGLEVVATAGRPWFSEASNGIATTSLKYVSHFKRNSQASMAMVNLPTAGVDYHVPFGGSKGSSYGPREQGR